MNEFFKKVGLAVAATGLALFLPLAVLAVEPGAPMRTDFESGDFDDEEMIEKNQQRMLAQAKRGLSEPLRGLKQLEAMIKKIGAANVPDEVKESLAKVKQIMDAAQKATTAEEFEEAGIEEIRQLLDSVMEFQREYMENEMRLREMRQRLKGLEQGLKEIDRVFASLKKQKITIPAEISDKVVKVREILAAVKKAKTWQEVEDAGIEDLKEVFDSFGDDMRMLEMLARWPKTLQQIDRELKRVEAELKRAKGLAASLAKKGLDLNAEYAQFEEAVNRLREARAQALAKIKEGDAEGAFELLEDGFFGAMEEVWQNQEIFMTMGNLGRFPAELKRGLAEAKAVINMLKRQKVNVAGLEELWNNAKKKGDEVLALIKAKPLDLEAVFEGMQELEEIRVEFDEQAQELGGELGEEEDVKMPWEEGPEVLKGIGENFGGLFGER